ncbi:hypothetical protein H8959_013567 [Pygathrix nigripes]
MKDACVCWIPAGLSSWKAASASPRCSPFEEPLLPLNPGERSVHVEIPRRARQRCWACSVGRTR